MRIAGILESSLVNGEGVRFVVFFQGCKHNCVGCQNPNTHDPKGGIEKTPLSLYLDLRCAHSYKFLDGITLSGGEPFLQQEEIVTFLKMFDNLNIWCYTGFKFEEIKDTELASLCDVIVDGKFEQDKLIDGKYKGSLNQRIIDVKKSLSTGSVVLYES